MKIKSLKGPKRHFKGSKGSLSKIKVFKGFKGSLGGLDHKGTPEPDSEELKSRKSAQTLSVEEKTKLPNHTRKG